MFPLESIRSMTANENIENLKTPYLVRDLAKGGGVTGTMVPLMAKHKMK